jgi:hypothetical protein
VGARPILRLQIVFIHLSRIDPAIFSSPHGCLFLVLHFPCAATMPYRDNARARSHSASVMHLDIMYPERLTTASFEAAVDALGTVLRKVANVEEVMLAILSQPMVFEVALSGQSFETFGLRYLSVLLQL